MTDTPSHGAGADARVHGDPAVIAALDIKHVDRRASPAEASAIFAAAEPAPPGAVPLDTAVIDASALKPQLLGLVRWAVTLFAMWLVQRGFVSQGLAGQLIPVLVGVILAAGTLVWSIIQKDLAAERIHQAAAADPKLVVLK